MNPRICFLAVLETRRIFLSPFISKAQDVFFYFYWMSNFHRRRPTLLQATLALISTVGQHLAKLLTSIQCFLLTVYTCRYRPTLPNPSALLVKRTPITYRAAPRSTAHQGLACHSEWTQLLFIWNASGSLLPSTARDDGYSPYSRS